MSITLQTDLSLEPEFHDGSWKCVVSGISYMAATKEQLLEMVRNVHPITDHTMTEQRHHDIVFEPRKYPL
jgi:hypothetical protein